MKLTKKYPLGNTGIKVPRIIYGTSYLGNLYEVIPYSTKLEIIKKWFECTEKPVVIDSAGKYGAGLALEIIGKGLEELNVKPEDIIISNKLGWYRVPLTTDEPTFEPGAWAGIEYDAEQQFGYKEITKCFEQGNKLLGKTYSVDLVSVHDPDEYLLAGKNARERDDRFQKILDSYKALFDLKKNGKVKAVGIGSKDWVVIRELYEQVKFDWIMLATSFTIFRHPPELQEFMDTLKDDGVGIINSAVFHGGFFTGGSKFDYQDIDPISETGKIIYPWRDKFNEICKRHEIKPADACLHFSVSHPAIAGIALNTSKPEKMKRNVEVMNMEIPDAFWTEMKEEGLIDRNYGYL